MNEKRQAEVMLRYWAAKIGLGFHPDTPSRDYDPPLEREDIKRYDREVETAFNVLGAAKVYEVALDELQRLFPQ